jgi:outer membrane protein W
MFAISRGIMSRAGSRRVVSFVVLAAAFAAVRPAHAEDTKGKWQFGFGFTYFATSDYIRSNSDIAIASSVAGQTAGLPPVTSVDPRPDQNMLNEPTVHDDFRFDIKASYGLTRWLAVEALAGYMTTSVGNIEYYYEDQQISYQGPGALVANAPYCGPTQNQPCLDYHTNTPSTTAHNTFLPVGTITEMPVQLSALIRFRPESPLDPYVGLGIGYLFTNLKTGDEFNSKSQLVSNLVVTAASEGEYTDTGHPSKLAPEGTNGFTPAPLIATVSSGATWHAVGGVDYFLNQHVSMFLDARFTWTDAEVNITTDGAHQVFFSTFSPGKLQRLQQPGLWEDRGLPSCPSCAGDGLLATEDSNGNGTFDDTTHGGTEGTGNLYFYPAGPNPNNPACSDPNRVAECKWTSADAVMTLNCTNSTCPWANNGVFDTEDLNGNRIMDRFVYYGVDVCSGPNPDRSLCTPNDIVSPNARLYLPPGEGCTANLPDPTQGNFLPEGCPIPHSALSSVGTTGSDNPVDKYLIQGGQIRLGGFSFGVGVKFTF